MPGEQSPRDRWRPRPAWSLALRLTVFLVPVACSVTAAVAAAGWLPRPTDGIARMGWWAGVLGASLAALLLVDLMVRRLLPLAALLRLSMLFPDQAPSRMRVARHAGVTGAVERQLARARQLDEGAPPAESAEIILTLVTALSVHDRRTRGHSERVHMFADLLGDELGLDGDARQRLRWAAMLHDIGKLDVETELLNKPGAPDEDEWERIRRHPQAGRRLIAPLAPWLGEWSAAVDEHHERYDGKGYPRGRVGEQIAWSARIVSVADAYEVMTAARSYKRPVGPEAARRELAACAGTQFDPIVVRAFLNIAIGKLRRIIWPMALAAAIPAIARPAAAANAPLGSSTVALLTAVMLVGGGMAGGSGGDEAQAQGSPPDDHAAAQEEVTEPEPEGEDQTASRRSERVRGSETADGADGRSQPPDAPSGTAGRDFFSDRPPRLPDASDPASEPPRDDLAPPALPDDDADPTTPDSGPSHAEDEREGVSPMRTDRAEDDPTSDPQAGSRTASPQAGDSRAAPISADDAATTTVDNAIVIDVLANDDLSRELGQLRLIVAPTKGVAEVGPESAITYVPDPGATGRDRFRYQVCYEDGGCATAWVLVTIERR